MPTPKDKRPRCPHCGSGPETFRYLRWYKFDVTRARELFGFTAKVSLRDGIARTVAWYRDARVVA